MIRLELNHWFINNNSISISLMRYFVEISIDYNDVNLFYRLIIHDSNKNELVFNFYSLEDAIWFTENVINKCESFKEIINEYENEFNKNRFKSLERRID